MITPATVQRATSLFSDLIKTTPKDALKNVKYRAIVPVADCLASWDWSSIRSAHNEKSGLEHAQLELLVTEGSLTSVVDAHCGTFGNLTVEAKVLEGAHIVQEI